MLSLKKLAVMALIVFTPFVYSATVVSSGQIQNIDGDNDGNVDDVQIDRISFTVAASGAVTIDADISGFDSYLTLFDSNNAVVAQNDDQNLFTSDSYLALNLTAGNYTAAIGAYYYSSAQALLGYKANMSYSAYANPGSNPNFGSWTLTINSPDAPIPEVPIPAALPLFMSSLLGLVFVRRRQG